MITAFVSDIHANLEALLAVMTDIESMRADRIICLGDVVNYGPDPAKCLRIVRKLDLTLLGNHEEAVLNEPIGFNPIAAEAARWTRSVLRPNIFSDGSKCANWEFMQTLPTKHVEGNVLLVHASPRDPVGEYVFPADADIILGEITDKLAECFKLVERFCFIGHTHLPGVFQESGGFYTPEDLRNEFRLPVGDKAIVNVGSVGQPRDRDPRACYVIFDGDVVRFRRIEYDVETTCAKVKAIRRLPERCGTRLLKGE